MPYLSVIYLKYEKKTLQLMVSLVLLIFIKKFLFVDKRKYLNRLFSIKNNSSFGHLTKIA